MSNTYYKVMNEIKTTTGHSGRLNIPSEHRKAMGLAEGGEVLVGIEGGFIRIKLARLL